MSVLKNKTKQNPVESSHPLTKDMLNLNWN